MQYGKVPKRITECKGKLKDLFKGKGVDVPGKAEVLVDLFLATEKHVTIDEFCIILGKKKIDIPRDVVNLALETLVEFGFAIAREFEGDVGKRYEHLHPHDHHDHFICVKCGTILEFMDHEIEGLQDELLQRKGLKGLFHKLEIYGVCKKCLKKNDKGASITLAKEGTTVYVQALRGGNAMERRLVELGFVEQEPIRVIKNSHFSPLVVEIKGSRFAIGRGQAHKIIVSDKKGSK